MMSVYCLVIIATPYWLERARLVLDAQQAFFNRTNRDSNGGVPVDRILQFGPAVIEQCSKPTIRLLFVESILVRLAGIK